MTLHRWFLRLYGIHLATFVLALVVLGTVYGRFLDKTSSHLLGDLFQVTLKHLEGELNDLPKTRWVDALSRYQLELGTPVRVHRIEHFVLTKENREALVRGEIVMLADSQIFLKQIESTPLVLALGPIEYLSFLRRERSIEIVALSLIALLLGIPAYLALQPLAKDLQRLDQSARQLSRGELGTRASLRGGSPILDLGETFDTMAGNLETLDRQRKDMLSVVSHELRLPIARLRYRLDWIENQTPAAAPAVAECAQELDALSDLVDELLFYSRLQQPQRHLNVQSVELRDWIGEAIARLDMPPRLTLRTMIADDAPPRIQADRTYIDRALVNLLSNAQRYAKQRIEITAAGVGHEIRIQVDDDGPGIPPDQLQAVFEPFTRLDRADTGYGLGLAIVRQIMLSHNGRAWAGASPLGGARLTMQWPSSTD